MSVHVSWHAQLKIRLSLRILISFACVTLSVVPRNDSRMVPTMIIAIRGVLGSLSRPQNHVFRISEN